MSMKNIQIKYKDIKKKLNKKGLVYIVKFGEIYKIGCCFVCPFFNPSKLVMWLVLNYIANLFICQVNNKKNVF